jgi:hypothetical protein
MVNVKEIPELSILAAFQGDAPWILLCVCTTEGC